MTETQAKSIEEKMAIIPLGDLIPTPDNNRKKPKKTDPKTKDLAESIKTLGQIQPGLARPHPKKKGKYDLRCGARRHMACQVAGMNAMVVIVRDLTDQEAMEATVTENLQREDLSPMEEAIGIKKLKETGWDTKTISAHIGKSERWVQRRAHLTTLTDDWINEYMNPKSKISKWTIRHLELVALLAADAQARFFKKAVEFYHLPTVGNLENDINELLRELKRAKWKLDDETLVKKEGSCAACEKRASYRPGLFEKDISPKDLKKDKCLDSVCWDKKVRAWKKQKEESLRKKHPDMKLLQPDRYQGSKGKIGWNDFTAAKKSDPNSVPIMDVKTCQMFYGIIKSDTEDRMKKDTQKSKPTTLRQLRKDLAGERGEWALKHIHGFLDENERGWLKFETHKNERGWLKFETHKNDPEIKMPSRKTMIGLLIACDELYFGYVEFADLPKILSQPDSDAELDKKLWEKLMPVLGAEIGYDRSKDAKNVKTICEILNIDFKVFEEMAVEALPEPAEWKDLNADGTIKKKKGKTAETVSKMGKELDTRKKAGK